MRLSRQYQYFLRETSATRKRKTIKKQLTKQK